MKQPGAVLFDLDGTLLDTVPDLVYALNQVREEVSLPALPVEFIRPIANLGSKGMIKMSFGMEEDDPRFPALREKWLAYYDTHLARTTQFFPEMETVLAHLENRNIPWGIVTNKLTRHTNSLLKALQLDHRPACVVSGDTLSTHKPDPEPIQHACQIIKQAPQHCIYVGDALTDVTASKGAGTISLVALYGYIPPEENPRTWGADGYIEHPLEIIDWLEKTSGDKFRGQ